MSRHRRAWGSAESNRRRTAAAAGRRSGGRHVASRRLRRRADAVSKRTRGAWRARQDHHRVSNRWGVLTLVDQDVLMIRPSDGTMDARVALVTIRKLERATGRRSRARYAGFGALLGLGAGALIGAASGCSPSSFLCSTELNAAGGGIFGAMVGAVTGASALGQDCVSNPECRL